MKSKTVKQTEQRSAGKKEIQTHQERAAQTPTDAAEQLKHGTAFLEALRHAVGDEESDATITIPLEIPMHAFDWVNLVAMSNHLGWTEEEIIGELVIRHLEGFLSNLKQDKIDKAEMMARFAEMDKANAKKGGAR
jgi:hypothetical protein